MALKYVDMVAETSVTTGTNDFELAGAVAGYRALSGALSDGDLVPYNAYYAPAEEFESGIGTWVESTGRLQRTYVLQSSNNDNKVSFSVGTKRIVVSLPGSLAKPGTEAISADYTATIDDLGKALLVSASGAARTITLPAAATAGPGFRIIVKKTDSSANTVTIDGNSSETIDGATTKVLRLRYHTAALVCDGTGWHVLGENDIFESGSGSGGDYVRYANGMQHCWITNLTGVAIQTAAGNIFRGDSTVTWTFEKAFAAAPRVSADAMTTLRWANCHASTTTTASLVAFSGVSNAAAVNFSANAIGRWF